MRIPPRRIELILLVLILLIGALLRFVALDSAPPGLTHDEADHALDAAGVVNGVRPIYFTVGYGREPLFDYSTALTMLVVGQNYLASRLTAALFGMALLGLVYAFLRRATGSYPLAMAALAGLSVSFWAVMVSREALRTITLPVMFMAAALSLWHGLFTDSENSGWRRFLPFALAGLFLGLSFYTYLAARVMWAVFPALFVYLTLTRRDLIKKHWSGLPIMLVLAALIAVPLFIYLNNHPTAEVRIGQLSYPIDEARAGRFGPLLTNLRAGLGMITFYGDDLWLYNIPGKPLLDPVMGVLFYVGFVIAIVQLVIPRRALKLPGIDSDWHLVSALMLLTLGAGLFPALVTGVGASNTRVIGLQPALYYFPALSVIVISHWAHQRIGERGHLAVGSAFAVLIGVITGFTIHDYFTVWNNARDVRVAYHTTLVETLHYIDAHPEIGPQIALSSITPGQFHDPAVARMRLMRDDVSWRFFDGRSVFLLPGDAPLTIFYPEVALPAETFTPLLDSGQAVDTITLREYDFNRTVSIYAFDDDLPLSITDQSAQFGDALTLLGHHLNPDGAIHSGITIDVLTTWQVTNVFSGEIVLFTHLLDASDTLVAQQDELGYPTTSWRTGDTFIQLHRLVLPADLLPGLYDIRVGAYTRPDIVRLPIFDSAGDPIGDSLLIQQIEISVP